MRRPALPIAQVIAMMQHDDFSWWTDWGTGLWPLTFMTEGFDERAPSWRWACRRFWPSGPRVPARAAEQTEIRVGLLAYLSAGRGGERLGGRPWPI